MESSRLETHHSTKVACGLDWSKVQSNRQKDLIPHTVNDQARRGMEDKSQIEIFGYRKETSYQETQTYLLEI